MRTYLLSDEEVQIIESKTGIRLSEERSPKPYYTYISDEVAVAIDCLENGGEYSEETIRNLRMSSDELTDSFIKEYIHEECNDDVIINALDEVFNILRDYVESKAQIEPEQ